MIKVNPHYLEANDPEKRSTLPYKEKEELVIEAIAKLYNPSKDPNIKLTRTKKNGLSVCSRNEVLQVLDWLAKDKHIIKTCPEDYPYKTISSSGFGDSYNEPLEIDLKKPFSIEVFSYFISWYEIYKARKNLKLSDLDPDQIEAVNKLYLEIKKEYKINPGGFIILTENDPIEGTLKHKALEFLKNKEMIFYTLKKTADGKQIIEISLDILKMKTFEKKNKEFLKDIKDSKENSSSPKKRVDKKGKPATDPAKGKNIFKQSNDYWTFYYTGMKTPIEGVKNKIGFHYIRHLLLNPNIEFEAFELDNAVVGFEDPSAAKIKFQNEQATSDSFGTVINSNLENFSTKKLKMDKKDYTDELKSGELTLEGEEEVGEKIRNITNELERRSNPDKTKRKNKIRMALDRAIKAIAKATEQDPPLFLHLQNHIRTSWPISYTPANPIKWEA